jgi:DNA mismatch repair protein MutL
MPIRQLPADVAAKIAAGEVVERPASVVKELVENALDAGARQVRVELSDGGLSVIRVTDDGQGIAASELAMALRRHATSKIAALDDLERIRTLGFRGEALASIAAVSRVTLTSRQAGAEVGAQVVGEHGEVGAATAVGAPPGTSVTVRDLFADVPARLKFLKSRGAETGHCLHLLEQYALAYPEVRFTALSEARIALSTPGDGRLASALVAVYGVRVADDMVPFGGEEDEGRGAKGRPQLSPDERPRAYGYTSRPTTYKATRQCISFFVNRRWVQSRTLTYAVEEAYHTLLLTGRHPIAVVNIEVDPSLVDVNVHPAKTEVKFLRERQVYAAVQRAVRAAVLATSETPEVEGSAFSVPGWEPAARVDGAVSTTEEEADESVCEDQSQRDLWPQRAGADEERSDGAEAEDGGTVHTAASGFAVPGVPRDAPVGGTRLPVLRVLGQVSGAYIVTEGPDGVYMIDQHAAHERVLLERMIAEWRERAVSSQMLLEPLQVELGAAEREAVEEHAEALRGLGFDLEPFGDALLVRGVPGILAARAQKESIEELLLELAGAEREAARHGETWEEHVLANVACKAAIKAGQTLAPEEQRELIRQLEATGGRQSCCHGRPTMVRLSLDALERQFDRR